MMGATRRLALACLAAVAVHTAGAPAHAYTVEPGDLLVRPVVGASVNALRYVAATRGTPEGGMIIGADFDYAIDGPWAATASLRPAVSPDYVDANLGAGVRYRIVQLGAPFIPWASVLATAAVGGPLGHGALHLNVGARAGAGMDYFVTRALAVGVEVGLELSGLIVPAVRPEATVDLLAGASWRF